jgi:hypothetical protein
LLCYLPNLPSLQRFLGQISVVDGHTSTSRCQNAMLTCVERLTALAGFAVLAHVDGPGGLETLVPGMSPHKVDVFCHPALLGMELNSAASDIAYAEGDPNASRAQVGKTPIERLGLGAKQRLARVLNSDFYTLAALGRNAQGDRGRRALRWLCRRLKRCVRRLWTPTRGFGERTRSRLRSRRSSAPPSKAVSWTVRRCRPALSRVWLIVRVLT